MGFIYLCYTQHSPLCFVPGHIPRGGLACFSKLLVARPPQRGLGLSVENGVLVAFLLNIEQRLQRRSQDTRYSLLRSLASVARMQTTGDVHGPPAVVMAVAPRE